MSANAMSIEKKAGRRRYDSNGGRTVVPEPVNRKSSVESFISFVRSLSQAYSQTGHLDEKEPIVWVRFFPYTDVYGYEDLEEEGTALFLALGYVNGMQMWSMGASGEAQEIFSVRDGPVKTACLLPPPPPCLKADEMQAKRPLLAMCLATESKQMFACVSIISLRTGEQVKKLQFSSDVVSLQPGPSSLLLITLKDSIHAFDLRTLRCLFVIRDCFPSNAGLWNPVAFGNRWLIYSPSTPIPTLQSKGGIAGDGVQSYVTHFFNAAKTLGKGISSIGETVNWLAAKSRLTSSLDETSTSSATSREPTWGAKRSSSGNMLAEKDGENLVPGLITVLDVPRLTDATQNDKDSRKSAIEINCEPDRKYVVAHFVAHVDQPVTSMCLCPSGRLLATADALGHAFHIFSILPHPSGPSMAAIHHLYTLLRGNTPAQVQELRFSWDSRLLVGSTLRGTCHIFPICPYGGIPNERTHTSDKIVNRSSTYRKSAGLDELEYAGTPPIPTNQRSDSPISLPQGVLAWQTKHRPTSRQHSAGSSRRQLLPQPVTLKAVGHIHLGQATPPGIPGVLPPQSLSTSATDATATPLSRPTDVAIATRFLLSTRSEKPGAVGKSSSGSTGGAKRLLVLSSTGFLTEYLLEPRPAQGVNKVSEESPVTMAIAECLCWLLQRLTTWNVLPSSLPLRNSLLAADNLCRVHYELMRCRMQQRCVSRKKKSELSSSSSIGSDNGLSHNPQRVCSEQPRSSEKVNNSRPAFPGAPLTRAYKQKKTKKSSLRTNNQDPVAPVSVEIVRNGDYLSADAESGESSDSEDHKTPTHNALLKTSNEWPSQVEMVTHEGPARRLWMGPQFHFKRYLSTGSTHVLSSESSALLSNQQHIVDPYSGNETLHDVSSGSNIYEEELDVRSLNIHSIRSEPVPTPAPRHTGCFDDSDVTVGCCPGVTIEAGSGQFDRLTHNMLHINANGSAEDRRYREELLKERIADAMLESSNGNVKRSLPSPPFSLSSSPKHRPVLRTKSDVTEYSVLAAEPFDFTQSEPPSLHLPGDK